MPATTGLWPRSVASLPVVSWLTHQEKYLIVFIVIQIAEFALLWQSGTLDLAIALCLSASLVAAGLFTRQRSQQRQGTVPQFLATPSTQASIRDDGAIARTELSAAISIDEQSQTWAELMARISHEIRTPLNAVIGFSDLMEREIFGPLGNPRYRDYAAHIKDSGEALLKSAEDTLALSSLLATPSPCQRTQYASLSSLAQEAWHFVEPQAARRGINMDLFIPDVLEVAGDRRALRQALSNLILEASQRASNDTKIEVRAHALGDTVRLKVIAISADRYRQTVAPSLSICVARALLEMQGTSLIAAERSGGDGWQATTVLDLAVQPDFFGSCGRSEAFTSVD